MKVIAIVSGGLDSTVLAYMLKRNGALDSMLTFDYGQRHIREVVSAEFTALALGVPWRKVDLTSLAPLFAGSALTDHTVRVPEGHYADESMRLTVVPNRNAVMLAIATASAVSRKANAVATAVHAGDHAIYPDCRAIFIAAMEATMRIANQGFIDPKFEVLAPFVEKSKADIVRLGTELDVPFGRTWSCYKGGGLHCGVCGTCYERREAFKLAGVADPTVYETDGVTVG